MFTLQTVTLDVWTAIQREEIDGMQSAIFIFIAVFIGTFSGKASCYETHGRVSINNYFLKDSSAASDYNISTLRINIKTDDIAGEKSSLVFKGRSRFRAGGREYSSEIPDHRINSLYLHFGRLTENLETDLGRFFVADARGARVDGVNMKYKRGEKKSAGLFAGGEPDPYQDSFNTDFFTFGGYLSHKGKKHQIALSSVTSYFKGRPDRIYVDLYGFVKPGVKTRLFHSVTVDYDKIRKRAKFSNISLALDSGFFPQLRMRLAYNRFQSVRRFESMTYEPPPNREDSYTLNLSYRGVQNYFIYSGAGYRYRTFDHRNSVRFFLGGRRRDFFGSGADLDLKYTYTENFTSSQQEFFGEVGKEFYGKLDLSAGLNVRRESFTFLEIRQYTLLYTVNADYIINKRVFLSANMEYLDEEGYNSFTFFTNLSYRF